MNQLSFREIKNNYEWFERWSQTLSVILQVKVVLKRTLAVVVVYVEVLTFSGFYTQLLK